MFENVKIPIDHHAIFLFCPFQNLLILSHLSESVDVPAGCAWEWDRDWYRDQLESIVLCRNVHRDRDREQDPLFSIVPVPFPVLIPVPFSHSEN